MASFIKLTPYGLAFTILISIFVLLFSNFTEKTIYTYESSGVELHYIRNALFTNPEPGVEKIINKNDFPVIVRCVAQFEGEITQWVKRLEPGKTVLLDLSHQHGFYIYTTDKRQKLIGFIRVN